MIIYRNHETSLCRGLWPVVEPTPLKEILVNWDDYSQSMEKQCSKPVFLYKVPSGNNYYNYGKSPF